MTDEKDTLRELAELADRNGRDLRAVTRDGKQIYYTWDKYSGTDTRGGSAADLLKWERGYISRERKRKA